MNAREIEDALAETLAERGRRPSKMGRYHPSHISGCPLKHFLDRMVEVPDKMNSWMFGGKAVHYYLQETDILREALHKAGYHWLDTEFEVHTEYKVDDDIVITGTCDVLAEDEDGSAVFDKKYSSIPPNSNHGRIYAYASQVNTYAHMFDTDEFALIMIHSKSDNLYNPDSFGVLAGEPDDDNWNLVKSKARMIHEALVKGGYAEGNRFSRNFLEEQGNSFWESILSIIDKNHCPAYDEECDYCDHSDYCPVYNSGLRGMGK